MNAKQNMKSGSTIAQLIRSSHLSQHDRNAALHDAHVAGLIVDAIGWVCSKFERPNESVFAKPNLKY